MALSSGARLGPYEISAHIGAGGMGEVYVATDTNLKRAVAIKVLPEGFAADPERLARFQREAEVLASLNHPNIAAIYGLERTDSTTALVMELVEGPTLADRIAQGRVRVDEALLIAKQIAEGLEAAHERGIVHRDLKPANIKLRSDGAVKILDFGLAKAFSSETAPPSAIGLTNSPTLTTPIGMTGVGMILGTAAYMSPEQAKGLPADHRSDVFAFGIVLYEMLAGRQPFQGDTAPDVLASILARDPDFGALPGGLSPRLRDLLKRCLEKNPKRRWQAIGDLRFELETIASAPLAEPTVSDRKTQRRLSWKLAGMAGVAIASMIATAAIVRSMQSSSSGGPTTLFPLVLPDDSTFIRTAAPALAISRDGRQLAYVVNRQLFVRRMSEMDARPIRGVAGDLAAPFFSPDGEWVGFISYQDSMLKKVRTGGGAAIPLCQVNLPFSASWTGNSIVFEDPVKGVMRVSAEGGPAEVLVPIKEEEGAASSPHLLDDGKTILFTLAPRGTAPERWDKSQIVVQSLTPGGSRTVLFSGGSDARYVRSGHILYGTGTSMFAVPFDARRMEVKGGRVPVLDGVMRSASVSGMAQVAVSDNGTLVYIPAGESGSMRRVAFLDRDGKLNPLPIPPAPYYTARLSPNGERVALGTDDGREQIISLYDLKSGEGPQRLTLGPRALNPLWSRDGQHVIYRSEVDGVSGLFKQLADRTEQPVRLTTAERGQTHVPISIEPSGNRLVYDVTGGEGGPGFGSTRMIPLDGGSESHLFAPFAASVAISPVFSPDGKWVAYTTRVETAALRQVFVRSYPDFKAIHPISEEGGVAPLWSADGTQLLYSSLGGVIGAGGEMVAGGRVFSVTIRSAPAFSTLARTSLLIPRVNVVASSRSYDITRDGNFIVVTTDRPGEKPSPMQINVAVNWFAELKARVPTN